MRLLVAGAGPAGLAAAHEARAAGLEVTLVERRGVPGGRAAALEDAATGEAVGGASPVLLAGWHAARSLWATAGLAPNLHDADTLRLGAAERAVLTCAAAGARGNGAHPLLWRGGSLALYEALARRLGAAGSALRFGARVARLRLRDQAVQGVDLLVRRGGREAIVAGQPRAEEVLEADAVVLALPAHAAGVLLPPERRRAADALESLGWHASVTVELWFEAAVTDRLVLPLGGAFAWALDRGALDGPASLAGRRLTLYANRDASPRPNADWVAAGMESLASAGCTLNGADNVRSLVLREPQAVPETGLDPDALADAVGIAGLGFAGDWADEEWFGTLEGAVRSGRRAVRRLLG